ncbi:PspA/IM30 family protein [Crocosphaera sp. UHCC 0190]|uniref:PspA/IM30 family protein n=1 Tax=Crocosphaera sp. UHCC 0190 TaxID=3110246 RepID=UPI002B21DA91|nr:PspA/IM30 family protein [Crocosphaera sp. UHCC 0190]MEA5512109.1 PspA/IM30 family protein [Crocosphaera sp. UHCC 0190]
MEWLERVSRAVRAQINSLVQEAEDPEKLLEEAIAQMEQELIAMRRALAEAIATHKSAERQLARYEAAASKWYERAELALEKGNEVLAREALVNRQSYQQQAQTIQNQLGQQTQIIQKVKQDLRQLEQKYSEAKAKKSLYLARLRSAMASQKLNEVMGNFVPGSSDNLFEKIDARILELEAQSELMGHLGDPLEKQFTELEGNKNIEADLANLKAKKLKSSPSELEELRAKIDKL